MFEKNLKQIALLSGITGLIIPVVGIMFAYYPGFQWVNNDISDFGLYSSLFNYSLIISGIFMGLFVLASTKLAESEIGLAPRTFLLLASACLSGIGIFPKDSLYNMHMNLAYPLFILFPLSLALIFWRIKNKSKDAANFTAVILAAFVFVWFVYFIVSMLSNFQLGFAIPETMSLILAMFWIFGFIFKYINKIKN